MNPKYTEPLPSYYKNNYSGLNEKRTETKPNPQNGTQFVLRPKSGRQSPTKIQYMPQSGRYADSQLSDRKVKYFQDNYERPAEIQVEDYENEQIVNTDIHIQSPVLQPREEVIYLQSPAPPPIDKIVYIDKYVQKEKPQLRREEIHYIDRMIEVDHGRPLARPRPRPKETIVYIDKYVEKEYPRPPTPPRGEIIKYVDRIHEVFAPRPKTPETPPPIEEIVYKDRYVEIEPPSPIPPPQEEIDVIVDRVIEYVPAHSYVVYEGEKHYDLNTSRIAEGGMYYDWWINGGWREKWGPEMQKDWQQRELRKLNISAKQLDIGPDDEVEVLSPSRIIVKTPARVYRKPGQINEVVYINEKGEEEKVIVQGEEEVVFEEPKQRVISTDGIQPQQNRLI